MNIVSRRRSVLSNGSLIHVSRVTNRTVEELLRALFSEESLPEGQAGDAWEPSMSLTTPYFLSSSLSLVECGTHA
jgi:hypothetical protein